MTNHTYSRTPKKPKSKKISFATGLHPTLSLNPNATDKKKPLGTPMPSSARGANANTNADGTRDAPIPIDDDNKDGLSNNNGTGTGTGKDSLPPGLVKPDLAYAPGADPAHAGQKRKRVTTSTSAAEGGKRKKVVDESVFHPDLQAAIREMRELIAKGVLSCSPVLLICLNWTLACRVMGDEG